MQYYKLNLDLSVELEDGQNFRATRAIAIAALRNQLRRNGVHIVQTRITTSGPSHEPIPVEAALE